MADSRFFKLAGPFTLQQLVDITGAALSDPALSNRVMTDVAPVHSADADKVSFLDNKKYVEAFRKTKAGACFVRPELAVFAPTGVACLTHKNPYKAYALAAQAFYPKPEARTFRHPTAVLDPSASLGENCVVGAGVVIGKNVEIADRVQIDANTVICDGVTIGSDSTISAQCYITHALIGEKVLLHPGVRVGRPGFGFAIDPAGYVGVPQLGRVIIEDDVEIGANSTIDRGAGPDTVIGQGSRLDNLVQIGHNVRLGKYCVMVSQSGIAGSTVVGDYVMIGGQTGIAGHLKIGNGAKIAGQSGVIRDVPDGSEMMGTPCVPIKQFMRQAALLSRQAKGGKR